MKEMEKGSDKVQKICELLKQETLEPAKQEAKELLENAKMQASRIVQEAKEKKARYKATIAGYEGKSRKLAESVKGQLDIYDHCPYCGGNIGIEPHADHIYPVSKGGRSTTSIPGSNPTPESVMHMK